MESRMSSGGHQMWAQTLSPPLTSCVTSAELLYLSDPDSCPLQQSNTNIYTSVPGRSK